MTKVSAEAFLQIRLHHARSQTWTGLLTPKTRAQLKRSSFRKKVASGVYLDTWHRIRETTPLILEVAAALNRKHEFEAAAFWAGHVCEEVGHDDVMLQDLKKILKGRQGSKLIEESQIAPPTAAIIGFFLGQAHFGNPHLLMVLRSYLELAVLEDKADATAFRRELGTKATRTIDLHEELDQDHIKECAGYLDRYFHPKDLPCITWCINFIADRAIEKQLWITNKTLIRR